MTSHPKLYVLTRGDLSPGQQATQSAHAAFLFAYEHAHLFRRWFEDSTYLVLLTVADEAELLAYLERLDASQLALSAWREPDMLNELTAVAIEPSPRASRLLSPLPLTGKQVVMSG